jgi:thioesterase domain-containing protein
MDNTLRAATDDLNTHAASPRPGEARLVGLRSGGAGPCFFLVPGTGGRIEGFADLANLLRTSVPVYAIEARGLDEDTAPDSDIEELVTHYLDRVRSLQPHGPYLFAGHSFGGMVVFEMAQRLLAAGETVGALMLLDTVTPKRYWPLGFYAANLGGRFLDHVKRVTTLSPGQSFAYYTRRIRLRARGLHQIPTDLKFGKDAARMLLANEMLFKKWRPRFYPGRLILFCCADTNNLPLLWRDRVTELEVHVSTGTHIDLIEPPHVVSLAEAMSRSIAEALRTTRSAAGAT